jgi:hypothetical protein
VDKATNTTGLYSWKFSPTEGLFMWKGDQTQAPLLKIDNTGLKISGEINAASGGNIGGFQIRANECLEYKLLGSNNWCGMGVSGRAYAFWAGNYTEGEGKAPGHDSAFRVRHDGYLYATNAEIFGTINATKGGNIGGFQITPPSTGVQGRLTSGNVGIGSNNGTYAFWAGSGDPANAAFSVKHDGTITATKLYISAG